MRSDSTLERVKRTQGDRPRTRLSLRAKTGRRGRPSPRSASRTLGTVPRRQGRAARHRPRRSENPGAVVVSLLERGDAPLADRDQRASTGASTRPRRIPARPTTTRSIWRRRSPSTIPNDAFRYFWLLFRREAFEPRRGHRRWAQTHALDVHRRPAARERAIRQATRRAPEGPSLRGDLPALRRGFHRQYPRRRRRSMLRRYSRRISTPSSTAR